MKKLLIVSDTFPPRVDGITRFISEILKRLHNDFDITTLSPDLGPQNISESHIFIPLSRLRIGDFSVSKVAFKEIRKAVKDNDIIFIQTISVLGLITYFYARHYKKKIVTYKHVIEWELVPSSINSSYFFKLIRDIVKYFSVKLFNKFNLILTPSNLISEKLAWYKIKARKKVVKMGIDTVKFRPSDNKKHTKESIGLDPQKIIIGYHGRLANEKNIPFLVRVVKRLQRKYPNVQLLVLGEGLDSIKEYLKKRNTIIISKKKNVIPYLQAMDIYVMPSKTETSCLSLIEAMSCALAVISTKVGLIPDYLKENESGFLIEANQSHDLYKALEFFIENPDKRVEFGLKARASIKNLFDWDKTAEDLKTIFNSL